MDFVISRIFISVNSCPSNRLFTLQRGEPEGGENPCQLFSQIAGGSKGAMCSLDKFWNLKLFWNLWPVKCIHSQDQTFPLISFSLALCLLSAVALFSLMIHFNNMFQRFPWFITAFVKQLKNSLF